ncbi:MAG: type I-B CRISPR-associated endonuclease Cas1b [bacterium]|nr:type I-B CRISPR-associated endonuclease Cas1b [bacterium]
MKKSLYINSHCTLQRDQNTLLLELEDGTKRYLPIESVRELHIFGEVNLNKRVLEFLSQNQVIVHFYNHYGYYTGSYYPREHFNSGYMILKQVEHYLDATRRLDVARRIVQGALTNLMHVARYYHQRQTPLDELLQRLKALHDDAQISETIESLMQLEGQARDTYYTLFDRVLQSPDFAFEKRTRRPPRNRLNALLSFGNSLLYTVALSEIYQTHLDPRIGYLHTTNFRRFTLNLDIAEVFKPVLVDRTLLTLIQKRQIRTEHFAEETAGIYLNEEGRKIFLKAWEERLQTTFEHRTLKRHVSYRTAIRLDLYKLEKHLIGEKPYEPFKLR